MSSLRGSASVLALSAVALFASSAARPAMAQPTQGIFAGGSTLASEAFRQIFDCYAGTTVGGDGFSFSSSFTTAAPTPGLLPTTCTSATVTTQGVQGLYAGVGSGNGVRGFVGNNPDEWYGGTINTTSTAQTITTPFPAVQPPFFDSNNTNFGSYPYPHVDIGLSDSPLSNVGTTASFTTVAFSFTPSTSWVSGGVSMTQITQNSGSAVTTYTTSTYGKPIQVPAFEVNVAIAVNVNSTSLQINSQITSGGSIVQGGAIQLTEGQLCAIFSGLVTNWNDTTTQIPALDKNGAQLLGSDGLPVRFNYANVGNGVSLPQAYANASLPINVVYRSDGSGTSFILTNYLHNVCPLLDPNNTAGYVSIFGSGAKTLPSTSFADLIANITAVRGNGVWNVTTSTTTTVPAWLGESGSGGVAATISDNAAQGGFIGYISADFTKPYASVVSGAGLTNVDAPLEASLQDENLRTSGTDVPSGTSLTFVAPTPAAADAAWNDARVQLPATTFTYADYNIYANTFTSTVTQGGLTLFGQSVLPLTNQIGAYPLSGTTFLDLYSCYNGTARATNLRNFLSWYYNGSDSTSPTFDPDVSAVIQNAGFHPLRVDYAQNIVSEYLTANRAGEISAAPAGRTPNGCTGVTGGAN
jgi:ABC-type phosphate transport system substrate-binding protein